MITAQAHAHGGLRTAYCALEMSSFVAARFIGLSVFGSRNQAKDHGLRTVQRSCVPDLTSRVPGFFLFFFGFNYTGGNPKTRALFCRNIETSSIAHMYKARLERLLGIRALPLDVELTIVEASVYSLLSFVLPPRRFPQLQF